MKTEMKTLLTVKNVADLLAVSPKFVYMLVQEKGLPALKVGHRTLRFDLEDLNRWLKEMQKKRQFFPLNPGPQEYC